MIKKIIILCMSLACLASCSKENDLESPEAEKIQVNFNVKTLDVDVQPMSAKMKSVSTRAAANTILTNIQYYLKNTTTGKVYSGEQALAGSGDNFGNIALWIPAGTYQLVFFGYGTTNSTGTAQMYVETDYNRAMINLKDKDAFYLKIEKTIGVEDSQVDVNLARLNGKLVIKLNDIVPSDIKKIKARITYFPLFNTQTEIATYEGTSGTASIMESYLTIENGNVNEFGFYLLPQTGRTLTLSIYDDLGTELGTTSVPVSIYRNKRTIVEGNLLDVINQKTFVVTVSDEWDSDMVVPIQ